MFHPLEDNALSLFRLLNKILATDTFLHIILSSYLASLNEDIRSAPLHEMNTQQPFGQEPHDNTLQYTMANLTYPAPTAGGPGAQDQEGHVSVPFVSQLHGQFSGALALPSHRQQQVPTESDAQIAARRAMAKRSSRSFASRITRSRSRKTEAMRAKPGITVDTSFARHRGRVPHQVYPRESEKSRGSIRKQGWFGLGRSDTANKGLGILKGMTPQPGRQSEDRDGSSREPKTADPSTAGSKSWQEISPWDRPIQIGLSVPSDSVADYSDYQGTRTRSDSDATLATPSIIITPAAAMKSVWSPDTATDYTPDRASSVYSRATHLPPWSSDVPPVPSLPPDMQKLSTQNGSSGMQRDWNLASLPSYSRQRTDTLDSNDTAFEEEQDDSARKDRIMSTGTVFEEDDTPLHEKKLKTLSLDTSIVPTPRRSQGWWNVITTPFVMSRRNSTWTQNGQSGEKTPSIPMVPPEYGTWRSSISQSTYMWSATERSPSTNGNSLPGTPQVKISPATEPTANESSHRNHLDTTMISNIHMRDDPAPQNVNVNTTIATPALSVKSETALPLAQPTPQLSSGAVSHFTTEKSASPPIGSLANMPVAAYVTHHHQQSQPQQQPFNINIAIHDGRATAHNQVHSTSAPANSVVIPLPAHTSTIGSRSTASQQYFPPPPTGVSKEKQSNFGNFSRASSPSSTMHERRREGWKQHRKTKKPFMAKFALCGRKKDEQKTEKKQKRSRWCLGCCCCLVILVLLAILIPVIVVFTRRHNNSTTPIAGGPNADGPTQWLNDTGFPPMKTGLLTIAQPEAVEEQSGCVAPTTLWSCALPKEQQKDIAPNKPDQPNFKVQITFENGTSADISKPSRRAVNPVSAGALVRSLLRRAAPSPSPAVPSVEDMKFLGQTTDGVSSPFEGESTPFFMSFQDPTSTSTSSRMVKRADDPTNITLVIPPPSLNSDGTAADANLLPFPSAQPLRLFNRGKPDEHYGFYTYFDRSIFLKDINSTTGRGGNPADINGGSTRDAASLRCTFSQTRFLVQIWTRSSTSKPLLSPAQNTTEDAFQRPGTFPYPVTFTLDRHGGDVSKKNLFCYKMQSDGTIVDNRDNKFFQFEDRGFGGNLVNGTQGRPSAKGPIDGGSGGCSCKWQNWVD